MDKAVHQPALPYVIIVLNATDVNIDDRLWDPEQAALWLLEDYKYPGSAFPCQAESGKSNVKYTDPYKFQP